MVQRGAYADQGSSLLPLIADEPGVAAKRYFAYRTHDGAAAVVAVVVE